MKRKAKKPTETPGKFGLCKLKPQLWALELPAPWEISETEKAFVSTATDNQGRKVKCLFIPIEEKEMGSENENAK